MCKLKFSEDRQHEQKQNSYEDRHLSNKIYRYVYLGYRKSIITKLKVARNFSGRYKTAHQISKRGREPGLGNRKSMGVLPSGRRMTGLEVLLEVLYS